MSDLPNNVQVTWQLVSQFVSWEFCRYMSEHNESITPETDVLTFLRNMIVERTEKSISEVTKHEIIAKFIMEINAVQNSQISAIIPLSESVKRICPELEPAVNKLIHHLETFFGVLDYTDEDRKELIQGRIADSIGDFSKEASRLLSQPKLLEVIDSWHHEHGAALPRTLKKAVYNAVMFHNVLRCLKFEQITPSEAKVIAVALAEDKVFEKIMQQAEAEPETEADSEPFSFSQSSQPNENVYSQESDKNARAEQMDKILLNLRPENHEIRNQVTSNAFPTQVTNEISEVPDAVEFPQNNDSPELISPPSQSPPVYPLIRRNVSKQKKNVQLQNNKNHNHMQFAQSSANESDEHESNLHNHITAKLQEIYKNQRIRNQEDSDTSDCEKDPEFRFLTPTYFKKNAKKNQQHVPVIYISDNESNNSSVITIPANSQQDDPNWTAKRTLLLAPTEKPPKRKTAPSKKTAVPKKAVAPKKTVTPKKTVAPKKKIGRIYSSSDSDEEPLNIESSISFRSPRPSTSAARSDIEFERPTKRRRPTPVTLSEVPVHQGTNTRSARKKTAESSSCSRSKKQKCKQCTKSFKTAVALRRHVFIQHSVPPEDSDCDP